jgi:hypothetical protein
MKIMEKLVKALNEYEWKDIWVENWAWIIVNKEWNQLEYKHWIISKDFWFIKWLIENKKMPYFIEWKWGDKVFRGDNVDDMIMLLSVNDQCLEFLNSMIINVKDIQSTIWDDWEASWSMGEANW